MLFILSTIIFFMFFLFFQCKYLYNNNWFQKQK